MKTPLPPAPRGQSTLELALGLMLFVSVVIFGIHFAEVGYLSIKVHEAAVSPIWDSTALRVHRMMPDEKKIGDFSALPSIAPAVQANANARYSDFDGRSSSVGGRTSLDQVFTRIDGLQVRCQQEPRVEFDLPRAPRPLMHAPQSGDFSEVPPGQDIGDPKGTVLEGIYENKGGMSCTAEAHLESLPTLSSSFLDEPGTGFFKAPHGKRLDMRVCALGRVNAGKCRGSFGILLGDFAFSDTDVSGHCPLQPELPNEPCTENRTFYYAAQKVFDNNGRAAGRDSSTFAEFFVGYTPVDESGFFMSYRGEEDGYIENDTPTGESGDMRKRPRNTGGVEHKPTPLRRDRNLCFLGIKRC